MYRNWKLSQDFSKELSFLNSSHGAIRCRSRTEHRENLISMSNPMKVFKFRHSLTSKPWHVWVSRNRKEPPSMWELGSAKWLKAKEQQRKGKSGMSDIFLGAWPLASPQHFAFPSFPAVYGLRKLRTRTRFSHPNNMIQNFSVSNETGQFHDETLSQHSRSSTFACGWPASIRSKQSSSGWSWSCENS